MVWDRKNETSSLWSEAYKMRADKGVFLRMLGAQAKVLDIGCWNYSFFHFCEENDVKGFVHFGIDNVNPRSTPPPNYTFLRVDIEKEPLPFEDDSFDAVVLSHVIEHVADQLRLFDEAFRVLRIGGLLYVECPSTRSLLFPSMPFEFERNFSLNFFDDPTHKSRPHSPQSLHRLFRMYQAEVVCVGYVTHTWRKLLFPLLLVQSWLFRNPGRLEKTVWYGLGFAVAGIARKTKKCSRTYVLI